MYSSRFYLGYKCKEGEHGACDLVSGICEVVYLNSAVFNTFSTYHNTYRETLLLCSCLYCFQQYGSCSQDSVIRI